MRTMMGKKVAELITNIAMSENENIFLLEDHWTKDTIFWFLKLFLGKRHDFLVFKIVLGQGTRFSGF